MNDAINSVVFNGYKSFPSTEEVELTFAPYVSVIIGKNNSGKSSCIDIIENALEINKYATNVTSIDTLSVSFLLDSNHIERGFPKSSSDFVNVMNFDKKCIYTKIKSSIDSWSKKRQVKLEEIKEKEVDDTWHRKSKWENVVRSYEDFQSEYAFRRINAERDIIPEPETDEEEVDYNGNGATNLLRKFVNNSKYDEKIVEVTLLNELNKIMSPDSCFKSIRIQEIEAGDKLDWEVFLEEENGKRFALSKSGSGLKTIILILLNLYVIPKLKEYEGKKLIYAFEEIENNLHPALQRKVFEYLYSFAKEHNVKIFITTHSHIAINTYFDKENTAIYHVVKEDNKSKLNLVENHADKIGILDDLEVKASDLFQSNGIIWVEGPSDRVYINKWLEEFCGSEFVEGSDYQFLYYGGKLLKHYSAEQEDDLISILSTNRNSAIVIDSDKTYTAKPINSTKKRIKQEFKEKGLFCWITQGKEIENYISCTAINAYLQKKLKQIDLYKTFPNYIRNHYKSFETKKVPFSREVCEYITYENSRNILDLEKQIKILYETIRKWNKKD